MGSFGTPPSVRVCKSYHVRGGGGGGTVDLGPTGARRSRVTGAICDSCRRTSVSLVSEEVHPSPGRPRVYEREHSPRTRASIVDCGDPPVWEPRSPGVTDSYRSKPERRGLEQTYPECVVSTNNSQTVHSPEGRLTLVSSFFTYRRTPRIARTPSHVTSRGTTRPASSWGKKRPRSD